MTTTLSYDLKKCMPLLVTDGRWTVLSVLILHTNIRNRCYVGMDTIAEMATGGNLTKATRAKKWLEQHGAFELVPYDKRVDDERELPKRQHVYQLTGRLSACTDPLCKCQTFLKTPLSYLHYGEQKPPKSNVLPIENISQPDVLPVENIKAEKASDVLPIENINGMNVSVYSLSKEVEQKPEPPKRHSHSADLEGYTRRFEYYRAFEAGFPDHARMKLSDNPDHKRIAREIFLAGYTPEEVTDLVQSKLAQGKTGYRFRYLLEDLGQARLEREKQAAVPPPKYFTADPLLVAQYEKHGYQRVH